MIHVLVGDKPSTRMETAVRRLGWGHMYTDRTPEPYPHEKWGFDNGAFVCWQKGNEFDARAFWKRLERALMVGSDPYVAIVPDKVAGGLYSLDFSLEWFECLPKRWPWYLAVQDDMDVCHVRPVMHLFAGLFLGGTTKFKQTSGRWGNLAHTAGKKFHYGRCSGTKALVNAVRAGADSCDTNQVLWSFEKFRKFEAKWKMLPNQRTLADAHEPPATSATVERGDADASSRDQMWPPWSECRKVPPPTS